MTPPPSPCVPNMGSSRISPRMLQSHTSPHSSRTTDDSFLPSPSLHGSHESHESHESHVSHVSLTSHGIDELLHTLSDERDSPTFRPLHSPTQLDLPFTTHEHTLTEERILSSSSKHVALYDNAPDHLSLFDQESKLDSEWETYSFMRSDDHQDPRQRNSHITSDSLKERETTSGPAMKQQAEALKKLQKDNFNLKLHIYYLENALENMSPEQMEKSLKENVKLRVTLKSLVQTIKEYKRMIEDLHQATRLLQKRLDDANQSTVMYEKRNTQLETENAELRAALKAKTEAMEHNDSADIWIHGGSRGGSRGGDWGAIGRQSGSYNYYKEWAVMKEEMGKKDRLIADQKRMLQTLKEEGVGYIGGGGGRVPPEYTRENHIMQSILSDRDVQTIKLDQLAATNLKLRETVAELKERNTDVMSELAHKKDELSILHSSMDEMRRALQDSKQQLRVSVLDYEKIRKERDMIKDELEKMPDPSADDLIETIHHLREEMQTLENERIKLKNNIEQRENDQIQLEETFDKLLGHTDSMEKQLREKTEEIEELSQKLKQAHDYDEEQVDEHVLQLEKDLSEKEDLIAEMKERLQQMDSQNADFHTYENQFDILNEVLKRKDACLQEMEEELSTTLLESQEAKARYDNDLKTLNIEFRGMLQKTQEREVRITTLEDDNEAQRDAFERERVIYADEIRDLAAKLKSAYHSIKQKDSALAELEAHEEIAQQLESYQARLAEYKKQLIETEELYQARVKELLDRLKEAEELVKQERRSAMETIRNKEKTHAYQREEIEQLKQRNSILLSLSSQQSSPELKASKQDGSRSSEQNKVMLKAQLMGKLNDELKKDLEERERELESSREMGQTLETSLNATTREYELLKRRFEATTKMLTRRNHQITRSMERFESASVRNETMGSILFQQAIEGFDTALLGNELENTE